MSIHQERVHYYPMDMAWIPQWLWHEYIYNFGKSNVVVDLLFMGTVAHVE